MESNRDYYTWLFFLIVLIGIFAWRSWESIQATREVKKAWQGIRENSEQAINQLKTDSQNGSNNATETGMAKPDSRGNSDDNSEG